MPRTRVVSADKYTFVYAAPIRSRPTPHAGAGRHLLQVGQSVEDALFHARQLVTIQMKVPVGMLDMSDEYSLSLFQCLDDWEKLQQALYVRALYWNLLLYS